jgi:hypothetical protein
VTCRRSVGVVENAESARNEAISIAPEAALSLHNSALIKTTRSMSKLEITMCETPAGFSHQFGLLTYHGSLWDLSHLDPFAFQCDLDLGFPATVLVLFSCHCFTHSFAWDPRPRVEIPRHEIYDDGREERVLCPERYRTSRSLLRDLVLTLPERRIIVADERQPNFMTIETTNAHGEPAVYAVFFEVGKDKTRKNRLLLRIQSAYTLDQDLTKRQREAKKVTLRSILRATVECRKIRP